MNVSELKFGDTDAAALAITLLQTFGNRARSLAEAQAEKDGDNADVAARWREVAKAIAVLSEANLHMETALDLLDSVEERHAAARLHHAITTLGIRPPLDDEI